MPSDLFGLIEFGSNSLKFYSVRLGGPREYEVETTKFPWRVAHEYFRSGGLTGATISEILDTLGKVRRACEKAPMKSILTVATGVFREIPAIDRVAERVQSEAGLRLRVISGRDEAKLMARSFRAESPEPVLLCDAGGATSEWAWIAAGRRKACGSLPLGAIRNHYALADADPRAPEYLERSRRLCDESLAALSVQPPCHLVATGGTAKAVVDATGKDRVTLEALQALIARVRDAGPPASLEPHRREVFLPGLTILERFAVRCGARGLSYGKASVRDGMAARLVQLLRTREPQDLHSTLLLKRDSSWGGRRR